MEDTINYHPSLEQAEEDFKQNSLRTQLENYFVTLKVGRGHLIESTVRARHFLNCDFRNIQIFESTFENCTFTDTMVAHSELRGLRFKNCSFIRCHFEKNMVDRIYIENSYFEDSELNSEKVTHHNLHIYKKEEKVLPLKPVPAKAEGPASKAETKKSPIVNPNVSPAVSPTSPGAATSGRFGQLDIEKKS